MNSPSDWWTVTPMGFVILALAGWRLASLLVDEDGPWAIFAKLRHKLGVRYNERSIPYAAGGMLSELLLCIWCTSVWTGASIYLSYLISPQMTLALATPLALSAVAILASKVVKHE